MSDPSIPFSQYVELISKYREASETKTAPPTPSQLTRQVGGDHYSKLSIQPIEYIHANKIPFIEGNVIKYVTRWRDKGGLDDLRKAKHFIEMLIEMETEDA